MADIELVIKIPEKKYQTIINNAEEILDESSFVEPKYLYRAVLEGTPLPKGHGDLYDCNDLSKLVGEDFQFFLSRLDLNLPQPIIKADVESI